MKCVPLDECGGARNYVGHYHSSREEDLDYCPDTVGCFSCDYGSNVVASSATSGLRVLS